jgi:hypothetical protein
MLDTLLYVHQPFLVKKASYISDIIQMRPRTNGTCLRMVRPHSKRAAAAGSDVCPRREGVRTVLYTIASSPSNKRRADAAGSRHLCFGDRFARQAVRNGGSSLCTAQYSALIDHVIPCKCKYQNIWKNDPRAIEVLRRDGDIRPSVPFSHRFRAFTTVSFFFYNAVLTEEEVIPRRNWTSWIKEK